MVHYRPPPRISTSDSAGPEIDVVRRRIVALRYQHRVFIVAAAHEEDVKCLGGDVQPLALCCVGDLRSTAKDRSHQRRIPAPMENPHHPKRLVVWCIGNEVLVAYEMESQWSSSQIRTSVSDVW